MNIMFKILVLAIIAANSIDCLVFTDCGTSSGKVTSISVAGCPTSSSACNFKPGTNASIDVNFNSEVNSNIATVKVWGIIGYMPIPFHLQPSNACGNWNIECPLVKGHGYDLKLTVPIQHYYPRIAVQVRVALIDSSNSKLFCKQFHAHIS